MPIPIVLTLTKAARASWAFIEAGVARGMSSRAIEQSIRAGGLTAPRRQVLLDAMRSLQGIQTFGTNLRNLGQDESRDPSRIPLAATKLRREFSYIVEVRGSLMATNEPFTQFVTVSSSSNLTRAEMEAAAIEAVETGQDRYGIDVESALPTQAVRAGFSGSF